MTAQPVTIERITRATHTLPEIAALFRPPGSGRIGCGIACWVDSSLASAPGLNPHTLSMATRRLARSEAVAIRLTPTAPLELSAGELDTLWRGVANRHRGKSEDADFLVSQHRTHHPRIRCRSMRNTARPPARMVQLTGATNRTTRSHLARPYARQYTRQKPPKTRPIRRLACDRAHQGAGAQRAITGIRSAPDHQVSVANPFPRLNRKTTPSGPAKLPGAERSRSQLVDHFESRPSRPTASMGWPPRRFQHAAATPPGIPAYGKQPSTQRLRELANIIQSTTSAGPRAYPMHLAHTSSWRFSMFEPDILYHPDGAVLTGIAGIAERLWGSFGLDGSPVLRAWTVVGLSTARSDDAHPLRRHQWHGYTVRAVSATSSVSSRTLASNWGRCASQRAESALGSRSSRGGRRSVGSGTNGQGY